ncbi:unnamed protein product [Dracunculus medinensis]|uniref:Uncharacterized protein n=1 Tax=Dracunculus medinensis TaxID=318479 RepID=A0A0N4URG8_DRAME|nr:unnamed protein product [Dracunculus medinensis]
MTMIAHLIILISFCNLVNGDEVDLGVCVKLLPTGQNPPNNIKRRPSVPVENCQDRDMACPEIFKFEQNVGMRLANNLKPLVSELFDLWIYNDEFIFSLLVEPSVDSLLNFHYCWRFKKLIGKLAY